MAKTELKVKAASLATFVAALAAQTFLASTATDYVHALPDWLEVPAYSLLLTAVTYVSGYATRNKPAHLAPSTITAVQRQEWMKRHTPLGPQG